jgi:hypothetical protein
MKNKQLIILAGLLVVLAALWIGYYISTTINKPDAAETLQTPDALLEPGLAP